MKAFLLLLLFTIISLPETASLNFRFFRRIPKRIPRDPIAQSKTDILMTDDQFDRKIIDQEPEEESNDGGSSQSDARKTRITRGATEQSIHLATLTCINNLFGNDDTERIWTEVYDIVQGGDGDPYTQAYNLCDNINVDVQTNCKDCIKGLVDYFISSHKS